MKKLLLILAICVAFSGALAETTEPTPAPTATPSPLLNSMDEFLGNVTVTWGSFLDLVGEAGASVSVWAQGTADQVNNFLQENMSEFKTWLDEAGSYFDQNVSHDIRQAWEILSRNAEEFGTYTQQEVQKAYDTINTWMDQNNTKPEVQKAVDGVAEAAGADTEP